MIATSSMVDGNVRVLLRSGADRNAVDDHGQTCLHIVASEGWIPGCGRAASRIVDYLLDDKAGVSNNFVDKEDYAGKTALDIAIERGSDQVAQALIAKKCADGKMLDHNLLRKAAAHSSYQLVKTMLDKVEKRHLYKKDSEKEPTPLRIAIDSGAHRSAIAELIYDETPVKERYTDPIEELWLGIREGNVGVVKDFFREFKRLALVRGQRPKSVEDLALYSAKLDRKEILDIIYDFIQKPELVNRMLRKLADSPNKEWLHKYLADKDIPKAK